MKINGRTFTEPNKALIVIPRPDGDVAFEAVAIMDYDGFDKRCKTPKAPQVKTKSGLEYNFDDPVYQSKLTEHSQRRMDYMVIESLKATEGLEWEKVDYNDPKTWHNWREELKAAQFSELEIMRIQNCVYEANSLNEHALEAARANFLRGRAKEEEEKSSGPSTEQTSTQSGEPASDSE